jgi:hypothetical protein
MTTKKTEAIQKTLKQKEIECNEWKSNYEKCLIEYQALNEQTLNQKQQYEFEIIELGKKVTFYCLSNEF